MQERFEGFTVADTERLDAAGIDRNALAEELLRSTLDQVLRIGFFHADPHPGNIFAFDDGTLGLIDFGAVGRLDPIQQAAVVDILAALMRRDVSLLRDGIERVADVQRGGVAGAARACARPPHGRPRPRDRRRRAHRCCRTSSRRWREFGIRLPGDLVVLSRALVTLDGTLRVLAPDLSLVAAATESMTSDDARRSTATR